MLVDGTAPVALWRCLTSRGLHGGGARTAPMSWSRALTNLRSVKLSGSVDGSSAAERGHRGDRLSTRFRADTHMRESVSSQHAYSKRPRRHRGCLLIQARTAVPCLSELPSKSGHGVRLL